MAKISLAVYGGQYEWLVRLKDFVEDKWVVSISDITYETEYARRLRPRERADCAAS